jgi:hypothetical protein
MRIVNDGKLTPIFKLSFSKDLLIKIARIIAAFSIFLLSINVYAVVSSYIFENVIVEKFALDGLEGVAVRIPSYQILLQSSTLKHITIVIGVSIFLFSSIIIGGFKLKILSLIALIFSSFWVLAVLAIIQLQLALNLPLIQYNVVYAELGNVSFYDANLRGFDDQGSFVEVSSPIISAERVKAYRAYSNGTLSESISIGYMPEEQFNDFLKMTRTFFNVSKLRYYENGELRELGSLHITGVKFKGIRYEGIISLKDIKTSEPSYIEGLMMITSIIAPVLMASYIACGFKIVYACSRKFSIGVGLIMLLILEVIAMFMGFV